MTKSKKDNKKITSIKKEIEKISEIEKLDDDIVDIVGDGEGEQIDESLPEDVEDALGINKVKKAIKSEVDYISELERGIDGFDPFDPDEDLKDESNSDDDF